MSADRLKKLSRRVLPILLLGLVIGGLTNGLSLIKIGYEYRDAYNEEMEQFLHENPNADIVQQRDFTCNSLNFWRYTTFLFLGKFQSFFVVLVAMVAIPRHCLHRWGEILRGKIYDLIYKLELYWMHGAIG